MNLTEFAFKNRTALLFVVVLLVVGGVLSYFALPVAIFPELTIPRIKTIADAGDTPPDALMVSVTKPIEQALATVPHINKVRSTTSRGETEITADFDWHTDMVQTLGVVNARLSALRQTLPTGTKIDSEIMDPSLFPIMGFSLTSTKRSQEDLYDLALYTIKPRLSQVSGIREIQVGGTRIREIRVSLEPSALQANGISASDVTDALRRANLVTAVGQFDESYLRHLVLIDNRLTDLKSIGDVVVTVKNRVPVRVKDVAMIEVSAVPQNVVLDADGQRAVMINILRQPGSNTVALADAVNQTIVELGRELPADVRLRAFYDQSEIVKESEGSVRDAVIIGAVLAGLVQLLFLGNLMSAGVVFLILPITIAAALLALLPLGRTLNIMTLGALAIALGLVIDDAVVVVENIFRYMEEGLDRDRAIHVAMKDIAPAMFGSSATTLVVFFPLLFLTGVTGNFFAPLALTMLIALTVSLLLSLFFIPVLAQLLLKKPAHRTEVGEGEAGKPPREGFLTRLEHQYKRAVYWCLRHRGLVFLSLIPLALLGVWLAQGLKTGFMPEMDEGGFTLDYLLPAGTSLTETDRVCNGIGRLILSLPDVSSYSRRTGTQLGFFITSQNTGDILVKLKPRAQRRPIDTVIDDLRGKIQSTYPNVDIDFTQILQDLLGDLAGSPSPIEVKIYGPDMATVVPIAVKVGKLISGTKGVVDERDGLTQSGPDDLIQVDSDRAAQAGLTPEAVSTQVNAALFGDVATTLRQGEKQIGVRVSYPQGRYHSSAELATLPVIGPDGATYPLSALAKIVPTGGATELNRENQRLMVGDTARISGTDLGTAIRAVQKKVGAVQLPKGVSIEYGGLYASQQQSFKELGTMLLVVAFLTLAVLLFYFGSFAEALALLSAGILSLTGVVFGLWITGTPLDISSFTGSILVIGIVVEGSFFLLDSAKQKREEGSRSVEALVDAGGLRLRPILMTKLTAILTLFPLALGIGAGAEMQKPLAIAVIGGVALSGFFTLFVTPTLYATLGRLPKRMAEPPPLEEP